MDAQAAALRDLTIIIQAIVAELERADRGFANRVSKRLGVMITSDSRLSAARAIVSDGAAHGFRL